MDEVSEEDKITVARARKIERFLSQPFHVAEVFTGSPGKLVDLADTIKGFRGLCEGKYDHLPEQAFYMVGTIEEAGEKGKKRPAETGEFCHSPLPGKSAKPVFALDDPATPL